MLRRLVLALLIAAAPTIAHAQARGTSAFDALNVVGAVTAGSVATLSLQLGASTLSGVGTGAGTLAAGNDTRIVGAAQNAAAAITGGTINGAVIGGSSPAAATFTTLAANGLTLGTPLPLSQGGCGATSALGCLTNLGIAGGQAGYVLTSNGPGTAPTYQAAASGGGGTANAVLYTAQSLTSGQQLQARQNIAAVASGDTIALGSGSTAVTPSAGDSSTKVATTAFVAGAVGGGTTLVASGTASAAATTDITLPAGFKRFIVKITGLSLSATGTFNAQLSNSGSGGVRAGASDYYSYAMSGGSAGNPVSSSGASSSFQIFAAALTNSGYGYNADFILYPGTSTLAATAEGKGNYINSSPNRVITTFGFEFQGGSLGRANLIRLFSPTGNSSFDYSVLGEN